MAFSLDEWKKRGRYLDVFGREVFVVTEGETSAPPLLILHGFPTFSYDFYKVLPALASSYRVIVHDHIGFGSSSKPEQFSYSLIEQVETAVAIWQSLGIKQGHLLAHDYGTSVATELLARRKTTGIPIELDSVTLCNGSVHIELAHLTISQRLMRSKILGHLFVQLANQSFFKRQIRKTLGHADAVSDHELVTLWEGMNANNGLLRLPEISQYLNERKKFWYRWIGAMKSLDLPVHILWGYKDPIAVPAIAQTLANEIPNSHLTWLEDLGHYPMMEGPEEWVEAVLGFLRSIDGASS